MNELKHLLKKKLLPFCFIICVLLFSTMVFAKTKKDKDFMGEAHDLTYEGQIEKAESLLGKEKKKADSPAASDWDSNTIFLSMLWGSIGTGFFIYGKKQSRFGYLISGIVLCVLPMFVSGFLLSLLVGLGFCVAPFVIEV